MKDTFKINVFNVINSPFCISPDDGQKIYGLIVNALNDGKDVQLSFLNITMVITAFLNEAIGVLYKDYPQNTIDNIDFTDISDDLKEAFYASLEKVKTGAPIYYSHQKELDDAASSILGE